jgi:hypothetical protein
LRSRTLKEDLHTICTRYASFLHPRELQCSVTAIICDNFSPHLSTAKTPGRDLGEANNVEIAYAPGQFCASTALKPSSLALWYFALDATDHASHKREASMIRRYITWRNNHAYD